MFMKITGIVSEYNPFHYGHRHHIEQTRKITHCDVLINVMSGNFVQRGEPAITDKWKRAKVAVEQGCDLILELPYPYVVQSSDNFAYGAVETLKLAGIDTLVFGSESNDIERLKTYAKIPFSTYKEKQINGISMAKAMEGVHPRMNSNDMLGISYIKALADSTISPYTIQRTNGYHDTTIEETISSATAIRQALANKQSIQHTTPMAHQLQDAIYLKDYYPYLQTYLRIASKDDIKKHFLVDEGIEALLIRQARAHDIFEDFMNACISKRYARSSIQRTLIHILTQTKKEEINALPKLQHIRVLAFNEQGKRYLHMVKKQENILIASRFNQIPEPYRSIELRSTFAYASPYTADKRKEIIAAELQAPMYIRL